MATENLHIEQRKVDTAMFNTKTRVLTVPILDKSVPAYTYDLFMGHEVGHALFTPTEDWMEAQKKKINKGILNVVEDSRIERKIKQKYPGLRNSFVKAYKDLHDQNFFETESKDLNKLNLIDRINLHQKVGPALGIKFNDEERELLNAVESTEKFSDVIKVSKKLQDYMKSKIQGEVEELIAPKQKVKVKVTFGEPEQETPEQDPNVPEGIDPDADTEFEIEFDQPEETPQHNEGEDGTPEDDIVESVGTGESEEVKDEEVETPVEKESSSTKSRFEQQLEEAIEKALEQNLRSFTDEAYKENEKSLFDSTGGSYTYVNMPRMDTSKAIMDYKELYALYKAECDKTKLGEFNRIRAESNKVVSYLVKEFELRKNADEMKRATVAKTGELNMSKIYAYKFTEDIFKKITVMPGGKSHGLVMFLDWSGSMHSHLENTIKQLISLVLFCKKVNIPYEVYAFSDGGTHEHNATQLDRKDGDLQFGKFTLLNFLSSRMSAADFTYACSVLVSLSGAYHHPQWLNLSSTPLNESISAAMDIIPEFQKKYRLQVVNTVFLTDGDSNSQRSFYESWGGGISTSTLNCRKGDVVVVRDKRSKNEVRIEMTGRNYGTGLTNAYIKLLKLHTHCNVVGFYIISGREFSNCADRWYAANRVEKAKEQFKKDRYAVLTDSGFDEYYFLRSNGMNTDDEEFEVEDNVTKRGLVTAFTKYAGNKVSNRVVLNRFIGMIT
jgi:hypothetical protein